MTSFDAVNDAGAAAAAACSAATPGPVGLTASPMAMRRPALRIRRNKRITLE
jgi:hypothetical protein